MRWFTSLALLAAVGAAPAWAGGEALSGNWKFVIHPEDGQVTFWLVTLDAKDMKVSGKTVSLNKEIPPAKILEVLLAGDRFTLKMEIEKGPPTTFEGKLPRPGAKKIFGTLSLGSNVLAATMEATMATSSFEVDRELLTKSPTDPRVFAAIVELVRQAKMEKVSEKEVKEWVDTALKAAEIYGPRMVEKITTKLMGELEKDFPPLAVELARKAEESLDPKASAEMRMSFLTRLASALEKAGKKDEVKAVEAKMDKLEEVAHAEHEKAGPPFKFEKFADKRKGNRVVLVELFTGAQCPPCVAADVAFDAVAKTFTTADVVPLQYHLHIPGPDALTSPDAEERQKYYGALIRGTPTVVVNGEKGPPIGGPMDAAGDSYDLLRKRVTSLLDKSGGTAITLAADRKGNKIDIKAGVKGVETPGDKIRLRFVLVEDWARYKGRNGLTFHNRIVRAMPGGSAGFPLTKKDNEYTASVDVVDVRKRLNDYMDGLNKKFLELEGEPFFVDNQRPMRFRGLSVVAFVQDDDSREVLQAVDIRVKDE